MYSYHYTLRDKFRYQWDNLMSRGPAAMIAVLLLATLTLILAAAAAMTVFQVHPADHPGHDLSENAWVALNRALDPGNVAADNGWQWRLVTLSITVAGIFVVSALISILSSGLQVKVDELRKGRSLVVERNHVVILGWSPKIFTIMSELVAANQSRRDGCIVILAEKDKVEMEDELKLKLPRRGKTRFVCRAGNPTDPHDLELVSPQRARAIIVLAPDGPNPDAETIKTILALKSRHRRDDAPYHIVAELRESSNLRLAKLVGKAEVEFVAADDLVARMTVQACREIGLSLVYTDLMDFAGGEMYFRREPRLIGRAFRDCIQSYENCAVVGVQFQDGTVTVNPDQDYRVQAGDRVVLLAEDENRLKVNTKSTSAPAPSRAAEAVILRRPEKVLVLGWNSKAPIILRELDRYMVRGSALTLVSTYDVAREFDEQAISFENMTGEYWTAPTSDRDVLAGLEVGHFSHALVLAYSDHLAEQECDSQTLMTLLNLRDLCDQDGVHVGLLSEMLDIRNRELAQVTQADDFIVSDRLVSMVISQVTENKDTMRIFDDLFHHEGSEMFLRPAEYLVPLETTTDFYSVCAAASAKGETAVGYRIHKQHHDCAAKYGLRMNPPKSVRFSFAPGDQVVVLARTDV